MIDDLGEGVPVDDLGEGETPTLGAFNPIDAAIDEARLYAGDPPITFDDEIDLIAELAFNIEMAQRAWLKGGLYTAADPRMIRQMMILDRVHTKLDAMKTRPGAIIASIKKMHGWDKR